MWSFIQFVYISSVNLHILVLCKFSASMSVLHTLVLQKSSTIVASKILGKF